jgi:hypothetical protein
MRRFKGSDLTNFLMAVDRNMTEPVRIIVIGGSSIALAFDPDTGTHDVDTYDSPVAKLTAAVAAAAIETGLSLPIRNATVAELPYHFEDRLQRVLPDLDNLELLVPDRHDIALSKILRGDEHDFEQIAALHAVAPLEVAVLVDRFIGEMTHVIGNRRAHAYGLLNCIEHLWGETERVAHEKRVLAAT